MPLTVTPLSDVLGARVEGLDFTAPLEGETFERVHRAFLDYQVLCFSGGPEVTDQDQVRLCNAFGKADSDYKRRGGDDAASDYRSGVMLVTNVRENGKPIGSLPDGEMQFHSDGAHRPKPYLATTLYAIQVPETGGDTMFANLYAAYDTLGDAMKARIAGLRVHNAYYLDAVNRDDFDDDGPNVRKATHPIVRVHPETGRKALYVSRLMTRWVAGLPRDEGDALLSELVDHVERPEFIYRHHWTNGDLLMWDNRCVNHARTDFSRDEVRMLRRYTISERETAEA